MIRVFVTGDNHIGLKYASHEKADILAKCRITAFENMVQTANDEDCQLFVITGDLFDNTSGVSMKDMKVLIEILSKFNGTVAVLPGNHDYYDKDVKVWQSFKSIMSDYHNIMLLSEYRPYTLPLNDEKIVLYPALCKSKHSAPGENNIGWIKDENIVPDSTYRIVVAHGAVEGETIDTEGKYFMMKRSELESLPADLCLIGHTHVPFPRSLTDKFTVCEKILNAGTHVQTDVNCNTEGLCFIVEIRDDKSIRAKKYVSGNLRFFRKDIVLSAGKMREIIERELSDIPDNSVVELTLSGSVTFEEYEERIDFLDNMLSHFTEGTFTDSNLSELISKDLIESEFPETSFSAKFLFALLEDPKEAQLAYEMLKEIKEGK